MDRKQLMRVSIDLHARPSHGAGGPAKVAKLKGWAQGGIVRE